jgi:hypothetical protein
MILQIARIDTGKLDAVAEPLFKRSLAIQDRKNSGIHPMLLTFGNDASVPKATGLEGHEGRGRRVFDWEDQFEVHRRFHGSDDLIGPFFSLRTYWGRPLRCQPRRVRVIYTLA